MVKRTPSICECGEHGFVACTMGYTTMFSPEDFALVAENDWSTLAPGGKNSKRRYAHRRARTRGEDLLHRAIMRCTTGRQVDHRDGNTMNNRRSNLRECSNAQNQMSKHTTGRVGKFRGVHETPHGWLATIKKDQVQRHLGYHETAVEAALAYDAAARILFGEFARPNFTQGDQCNGSKV